MARAKAGFSGREVIRSVPRGVVRRAALLAALGAACGPRALPADPKHDAKVSDAACDVRQPYLVDLPSLTQGVLLATLESTEGRLVAVRYVGCDLSLLSACRIPGGYAFAEIQPIAETVAIPGNGERPRALTRGFAELPAGEGELELVTRTTGVVRAAELGALPEDLGPACAGATHVISNFSIGDYEVTRTGPDGEKAVLKSGGRCESNQQSSACDRVALRADLVPLAAMPTPCAEGESPETSGCVASDWPLPPEASAERKTVAALLKALRTAQGDTPKTRLALADSYERAQMDEGVLRALEPLATADGPPEALLPYARAALRLGRDGQSLRALRALVVRPEKSDARAEANLEVARYFCEREKFEDAQGFLRTLLEEYAGSRWHEAAAKLAETCRPARHTVPDRRQEEK